MDGILENFVGEFVCPRPFMDSQDFALFLTRIEGSMLQPSFHSDSALSFSRSLYRLAQDDIHPLKEFYHLPSF